MTLEELKKICEACIYEAPDPDLFETITPEIVLQIIDRNERLAHAIKMRLLKDVLEGETPYDLSKVYTLYGPDAEL
jgi:hypothetical protein